MIATYLNFFTDNNSYVESKILSILQVLYMNLCTLLLQTKVIKHVANKQKKSTLPILVAN